jgi:anti-sigma regulatory factor (Ser/Thr protein kinase)
MRAWEFDDSISDAELLVSELVTNAVLHARSETEVTIEREGSTVRVSVHDTSSARPRLRELGPESVTGRGLLLVDRIAHRWGFDAEPDGKSVWFEIDGRARVDGETASTR